MSIEVTYTVRVEFGVGADAVCISECAAGDRRDLALFDDANSIIVSIGDKYPVAADDNGLFVGQASNSSKDSIARAADREPGSETPPTDAALQSAEPADDSPPELPESRPITRVVLPRIRLVADVVPAELVQQDDGLTWLVPSFKAGHAQYTAGAGQPGNGVLFGHVTSRSLGNVFEQLYRAHVGDIVQVFAETEEFNYHVVEVQAVSRTDVSVLAPTDTPSVSLITCTGDWNAALHDYMQRLVVRAELA